MPQFVDEEAVFLSARSDPTGTSLVCQSSDCPSGLALLQVPMFKSRKTVMQIVYLTRDSANGTFDLGNILSGHPSTVHSLAANVGLGEAVNLVIAPLVLTSSSGASPSRRLPYYAAAEPP